MKNLGFKSLKQFFKPRNKCPNCRFFRRF